MKEFILLALRFVSAGSQAMRSPEKGICSVQTPLSQQLATARVEDLCPLQVRVSKQGYRQPPSSTSPAPPLHWYKTQHEAFSRTALNPQPKISSPISKAAPGALGSPRAAQAAGVCKRCSTVGTRLLRAPPLSLPVELYLIEGKKMETRHKQTSNISILQVNHLHWPRCATAQRGERQEQPLKLGARRQMKEHLEIISSQVNRRLANFGRGLKF